MQHLTSFMLYAESTFVMVLYRLSAFPMLPCARVFAMLGSLKRHAFLICYNVTNRCWDLGRSGVWNPSLRSCMLGFFAFLPWLVTHAYES
jgi:hypothetical protein